MVYSRREAKVECIRFKVQNLPADLNFGRRPLWKKIDIRSQNFRLRAVPDGVLAQLVEHHNGIVGVKSSSLLGSTILKARGD